MSVRKFYYKEKLKCAEGEHDFCVIRRKYTHPHCVPPNSVRKVIWLVKKENFCRSFFLIFSQNLLKYFVDFYANPLLPTYK